MIDFVLVENALVCVLLSLFVDIMALGVVYLTATVVDHVYDVRRNVKSKRRM